MANSLRLLMAIAAGTLLLPACLDGSDVAETPSVEAGATFNDGDVAFAQGMIALHAQGVEISNMALLPEAKASSRTQELASRIIETRESEIEKITEWLRAHDEPVRRSAGEEATSSAETVLLSSWTGRAFDTAWAEAMIRHRQRAIAHAQIAKVSGMNSDMLDLADETISAAQFEITRLETLITT